MAYLIGFSCFQGWFPTDMLSTNKQLLFIVLAATGRPVVLFSLLSLRADCLFRDMCLFDWVDCGVFKAWEAVGGCCG